MDEENAGIVICSEGGGEHFLKNGVWVCAALKTPFHTLLGVCKTPISACFSSQDPTFTTKWQISKMKLSSKWGESLVQKPQIGPEFSSHGYIFRNSVF